MLLRSTYFKASRYTDNKRTITKEHDKQNLIILKVERVPSEPPYVAMEVTEEIPKKMAKLWKVPYNRLVKPMVKVRITFDTRPVLQYYRDFDRLYEYADSKYIGDPRHKEWEEKVNSDAWFPMLFHDKANPDKDNPVDMSNPFTDNPKVEYYIVNFKSVGKNIIPTEDKPVTDKKIIKEMAQYGLGSGYPRNRMFRLRAKRPNELFAREPRYIPMLGWNFNGENVVNQIVYDEAVKMGHGRAGKNCISIELSGIRYTVPQTRPATQIDSFYVHMYNEEKSIKDYVKDMGSLYSKINEDTFEEYNAAQYQDYWKEPNGPEHI